MLEMLIANCPDCNALHALLAKPQKLICENCGAELELKVLDEAGEEET